MLQSKHLLSQEDMETILNAFIQGIEVIRLQKGEVYATEYKTKLDHISTMGDSNDTLHAIYALLEELKEDLHECIG